MKQSTAIVTISLVKLAPLGVLLGLLIILAAACGDDAAPSPQPTLEPTVVPAAAAVSTPTPAVNRLPPPTLPWTDPEDLIRKQINWLNDGEFEKASQTCLRFAGGLSRYEVPLEDVVAEFQADMESLGISKLGVKDISVDNRVVTASASFTLTGDGEDLETVEDLPFISYPREVATQRIWVDDSFATGKGIASYRFCRK